ncbi:Glucans biosynthesis protein C [Paenibacillus plantiphilus]|uniref:Glucans biosynthesis protein C n=1 Tax=Paenibacillus plantiphilus TaxID=2905650 RepID=A0ABM9C028_9BACL|nr:acyltransferase [Paenibacillus plantiphilus]CAH1199082.1 Glucans biosynthesis protein C [Paenibacillus plantiphilus]
MNTRLFFLDSLKVALICLVVAHHAGQPYGGSDGFWYFQSHQEAINLGTFFSINSAFFMSLFFFISAYFVPSSFDKKGPALFIKERLKRLGLPLLLGFFILIPVLMYAFYINFRGYESISFYNYYTNIYLGLGVQPEGWTGPSWPDLQFAHLWFIEHLLVYAVLYSVIRLLWKKRPLERLVKQLPSTGAVVLFGVLVALATFAIRILHPIDEWTGFLGFIQTEFAHVPQYAAFFIAGILAYRNNWLHSLSHAVGITWLAVGVALMVFRYAGWVPFLSKGGFNGASLGYSFYETFLCLGLSIGLLYAFRELGNRTNWMTSMLARNAFTVYVLHVPIVVCLQYVLENTELSTMTKFLVVATGGIVLSFFVSHGINQITRRFGTKTKQNDLPS